MRPWSIHVPANIPKVKVKGLKDAVGTLAKDIPCGADEVVAIAGAAGSMRTALLRTGLATQEGDLVHATCFAPSDENLAKAKRILRSLCELPGAMTSAIAPGRETIALLEVDGGFLTFSPYLGTTVDAGPGQTATSIHIGLFGEALSPWQSTSFESALAVISPGERPTSESDVKDERFWFDAISEREWSEVAMAIALTCGNVRASIASGNAVSAILTSWTTQRPCSISFVETTHGQVPSRQQGIRLEPRASELVDALCQHPLARGNRSAMRPYGVQPLMPWTRMSSFSIKPRMAITPISPEQASATLRAAQAERLLSHDAQKRALRIFEGAKRKFALRRDGTTSA